MDIKLLNPKTNISSLEDIEVKVYAHTAFAPATGVTTLSYTLYDLTSVASSGAFVESSVVSGLYEANTETSLANSLVAGTYFLVISETTTPVTDVVMFTKGGDLAAAELLLEQNQRREFTVSSDKVDARNVVAGAVSGFTLKTKNSSDTDFDSPVTTGTVNFTYEEMSPTSRIKIAEPEASS